MTAVRHPPVGRELLDTPDADPVMVRRALRDIARANRWFGGVRAMQRGLEHLLASDDRPRSCTLLDIGVGAGDLPLAAARWGGRRGVTVRSVGIDRHRAAAALAASAQVASAQGCGSALPIADRGVDLVLLSQFLHHLDDLAAIAMLREAIRVARRGVIVADLTPSKAAAGAFRLGGWLFGMHPVTIADGVTSLARGRAPEALLALAHAAGARKPSVWRSAFARVTVAWRTDT